MNCNKIATVEQYIRRLSGQEKEPQNVDHNYNKSWSAHPDSIHTKPAKLLFMNILPRYNEKNLVMYDDDEEIDIITTDISVSPFDTPKSKAATNDIEQRLKQYSHFFDEDRTENEDFLESCTFQQQRIYRNIMEVLNADVLAKSVYSGQPHETIKKKTTTEKFANDLRLVFANNFYDFDLIFWLNKVILEEATYATVVSYLSLLQTLRAKIPALIDKILKSYSGCLGEEFLFQIVKKQSDPIAPILNQHKPKKLPTNPFLLISCAGFDYERAEERARFSFWTNNLNALCKTIYVPLASDDGLPVRNTVQCVVDVAMTSMKNKIVELKNHFPNRPIIVAGWTVGAVIACHVALEMPVDAVICFGFPLTGVNGSRGDLDDPLLNCAKPTLFIVGQNANMCSIDDVEDFRSRMTAETGLVVVGGADDYLRIRPKKMLEENITQAIVDRCILDEISDFLQATLGKLPSTSSLFPNSTSKSCPTIMEEESVDSAPESERKRKRRKATEYSPELPSSKRFRRTIPKESPSIPSKSHLSLSNSKTSPGLSKSEEPVVMKPGKRNPEKRGVGRPPGSTSRKRTSLKPVVKPVSKHIVKPIPKTVIKTDIKPTPETGKGDNSVNGNSTKNISRNDSQMTLMEFVGLSNVFPEKPTELKATIPFALNILPKKNDPVDVEKAFGKDSSFLPRPLTPPENEEIHIVEKTEKVDEEPDKAIIELVKQAAESKIIPIPESEPFKVQIFDSTVLQSQTIPPSEKSIMPVTEQPSVSGMGSKVVPASIIKPIVNSDSDVKKRIAVSVATSSFKTVFQQGKVLNPSPVAQIKNISGVKFIGKPINQTNTVNTSKSTIAIPSNNDSVLKAQSGRVLKLLSKGPIALKKKDSSALSPMSRSAPLIGGSVSPVIKGPASPVINSSTSPVISGLPSPDVTGSADLQGCNLSLLSDVAGMTKPLKDAAKTKPRSSSATVVKLAVPDKPNLRHIQLFRPLQTHPVLPSSTIVETPEERVEKQLAIQALNKSIGGESSTQSTKESGYSICFTKPDGSIFSRTVPKISNTTYLRQSLLPSARGKPRYIPPGINFVKK